MSESRNSALGIIPARYASTRFPGKPLAVIAGKPMIQHVYERARQAEELSDVWITTDDGRIKDAAEGFGAKAVMTSADCRSGTDRVFEASRDKGYDIIINIQGDEPLIAHDLIDEIARALKDAPDRQIATACYQIIGRNAALNPNLVKVVRGPNLSALYFSRSIIPYSPPDETASAISHPFHIHIGIYGYRYSVLEKFVACEPSALEKREKLEQLRALENGLDIFVIDSDYQSHGVDSPSDVAIIEGILERE